MKLLLRKLCCRRLSSSVLWSIWRGLLPQQLSCSRVFEIGYIKCNSCYLGVIFSFIALMWFTLWNLIIYVSYFQTKWHHSAFSIEKMTFLLNRMKFSYKKMKLLPWKQLLVGYIIILYFPKKNNDWFVRQIFPLNWMTFS